MTVADRIKQIREKKSLSQDSLAQKLGLKNRSSISRIESSGNDITLKDVERIASALDVSVAYLMGYEDIPTPYEYAKEDDYISLTTKIDKQTLENTRPMIEEKLKTFILERYKSLREFTIAADIPYSTMNTILARGIENSSFSNVVKICTALNISMEGLAENEIRTSKETLHNVNTNDILYEVSQMNDDQLKELTRYAKYINKGGG